jgi:hypothetical protein
MKKLSGKMAPLRAQTGRVSVAIGWQAGEKAADHRSRVSAAPGLSHRILSLRLRPDACGGS